MFISIPDEIFLEILKYLNNNRSVINFLKTCKYIKNLYYKNGYLKQINLDPLINNDPYNFATNVLKLLESLIKSDPCSIWIHRTFFILA